MARKRIAHHLTEHQAYQAMLKFLERRFGETGSDDLGALLGSIYLLNDGGSADPAMRDEWRECVAEVIEAGEGTRAAE